MLTMTSALKDIDHLCCTKYTNINNDAKILRPVSLVILQCALMKYLNVNTEPKSLQWCKSYMYLTFIMI